MGGKPRTTIQRVATGRDISISEFFLKNRHLLGFDSPKRALLTAVKEAVDNSLDACEEADILPEVWIEVDELPSGYYRLAIEDNGPGIADADIARIFGKLLYGSKFHRLAQSRGQQGLGISAAGMYAQLTSGRPMRIVTRHSRRERARELRVSIDTARNRPDIHSRDEIEWRRSHGTRVELELEGQYLRGSHSIVLYLKLTAMANPHVSLHLCEPDGGELSWERTTTEKPDRPHTIKPHPHGIEVGQLIAMLKGSPERRLGDFLREEFSQVGKSRAREIVSRAGKGLTMRSNPRRIARQKARVLHRAINATRVSAPPTDCVVPIGEDGLLDGLDHEVPSRFSTAVTRRPAVYRGNPFVIEVGLTYGSDDDSHVAVTLDGRLRQEGEASGGNEPARLLRFANRVPLLYQQGHCAMTRAVRATNWRRYGVDQDGGGMPRGPMTLLIHMASVWVPFTSESKEAVASYEEIEREIELALAEVARRLAVVLRRQKALKLELRRRKEIERYLPHVGDALAALLDWSEEQRDQAIATMDETMHRTRSAP